MYLEELIINEIGDSTFGHPNVQPEAQELFHPSTHDAYWDFRGVQLGTVANLYASHEVDSSF